MVLPSFAENIQLFQGTFDNQGQAQARVNIPSWRVLIGLTLHSAFVALDQSAPFGIKSISNTLSFSVSP